VLVAVLLALAVGVEQPDCAAVDAPWLPEPGARPLAAQLGPQAVPIEEQLRDDLPVELNHRDPREEARVQPRIGLDIDFLELKVEPVGAQSNEALPGLVAEVAVRPPVEPD